MKMRMIVDEMTTRRGFLGGAAALAASAMMSRRLLGADALPSAAGKPNSVFNGVRIGCISYSFRADTTSAKGTLDAFLQCGLSEAELMGDPIQDYTGIIASKGKPGKGKSKGKKGKGKKAQAASPAPKVTDAQREEQLAKCREFRKMYNDAGVNIHLHKIPFGQSNEEIDFNFEVAKALGCIGITLERPKEDSLDTLLKKLAPFADKHKIWLAFHNHTTNYPVMEKTDPLLAYGQYVGFNFDTGHYLAGTKGLSPIPVIEKYHDRIVSLHLKDRTADGGNLPFGQGTTPLKEMLQLVKKEKWTFPCDIELEYKIPEGSTSVAEVAKCVAYCREALA